MSFKSVIDSAVASARFSIDSCINFEEYLDNEQIRNCNLIKDKLSAKEFKAFKRSIVRNSFLIEPVNDDITSTKVEAHWSHRLENDVRYSTYEMCVEIFTKILNKVANLSPQDFNLLKEFFCYTVVPYEMPIDYINRFATTIHTEQNIDLFLNDDIKNCIIMRRYIRDPRKNPSREVFLAILADKIKVKTYLTDRALTGDYKTNREKRWETHPNSVQYALRRDCMKIETKLLLQIATFYGCNIDFVQTLQNAGLLSNSFEYCKCPITGDVICYDMFADDALHPTHGKSKFQVGHLNPLKAFDVDGVNGHTADNISWISENGNRIQGSLSLDEVDSLLKRIYCNRPELHN